MNTGGRPQPTLLVLTLLERRWQKEVVEWRLLAEKARGWRTAAGIQGRWSRWLPGHQMSLRVAQLLSVDSRRQGDRVIQIFVEWPERYGTVLKVKAAASQNDVLIGWDDGRRDWIKDEDFGPLRIWLIQDDERRREMTPGPLELQLSGYLQAEAVLPRPPRSPKGRS